MPPNLRACTSGSMTKSIFWSNLKNACQNGTSANNPGSFLTGTKLEQMRDANPAERMSLQIRIRTHPSLFAHCTITVQIAEPQSRIQTRIPLPLRRLWLPPSLLPAKVLGCPPGFASEISLDCYLQHPMSISEKCKRLILYADVSCIGFKRWYMMYSID